jgi:hypothetical protein
LTLTFVACSGARVNEAWSPWEVGDPKMHSGEKAQLASLGRDDSLVTLTFGGNDLNFSDVVHACVTPAVQNVADCVAADDANLKASGFDRRTNLDGRFYYYGRIPPPTDLLRTSPDPTSIAGRPGLGDLGLHDKLVLLLRQIRSQAPFARILIMGYPRWFESDPNQHVEHFSELEQGWLNDRIALADKVIADAAQESGTAEYVDNFDSLRDHELDNNSPAPFPTCPAGPFINGVDLRAGFYGSAELMHPSPCAHRVWGQLLATAYRAGAQAAQSCFDQVQNLVNQSARGENSTVTISTSSYSIGPQGRVSTSLIVPAGVGRLDVSTTWLAGNASARLVAPDGHCVAPLTQRMPQPCSPSVSADGYLVWTVWDPPKGTWTFAVDNPDSVGNPAHLPTLGVIRGRFQFGFGADIPMLPAAGHPRLVNLDCILEVHCTAKITVDVSPGEDRQFTWYDDNGGLLSDVSGDHHETVKASFTRGHLRVILKTSRGQQYRYGVFCQKDSALFAC